MFLQKITFIEKGGERDKGMTMIFRVKWSQKSCQKLNNLPGSKTESTTLWLCDPGLSLCLSTPPFLCCKANIIIPTWCGFGGRNKVEQVKICTNILILVLQDTRTHIFAAQRGQRPYIKKEPLLACMVGFWLPRNTGRHSAFTSCLTCCGRCYAGWEEHQAAP